MLLNMHDKQRQNPSIGKHELLRNEQGVPGGDRLEAFTCVSLRN
jgi:hypothetical protein